MRIEISQTDKAVLLIGAEGHYELKLDYYQALGLAAQLEEAASAVEPQPQVGLTYCPTPER